MLEISSCKVSRPGALRYLVVIFIAVILLTNSAYIVKAEETVRIGAVYPLSGSLVKHGTDMRRGIELAGDIINNKYNFDNPFAQWEGIPSLNGAKLEIVFADTEGQPEIGAAEAERLITTQKVKAILGAWQSGVTHTVSPVCERYNIPIITISVATGLTERGFDYIFRVGVNAAQAAESFFEFSDAMTQKKGKTIKTYG